MGFPCGSAGKEFSCNPGDLGSTSGLGRSPGEGKCHPLQYSGLKIYMDSIVHRVVKSRTQLSNFHFHIQAVLCFMQYTSCFSRVQLCATPWTVAQQAPLSKGFSRKEYCSGWPCRSPGDLPNPWVKPASLTSIALATRFFTFVLPGKPIYILYFY